MLESPAEIVFSFDLHFSFTVVELHFRFVLKTRRKKLLFFFLDYRLKPSKQIWVQLLSKTVF